MVLKLMVFEVTYTYTDNRVFKLSMSFVVAFHGLQRKISRFPESECMSYCHHGRREEGGGRREEGGGRREEGGGRREEGGGRREEGGGRREEGGGRREEGGGRREEEGGRREEGG